MAYTAHGHQIPGTIAEEVRPASVARCGGVNHCKQCKKEAEMALHPSAGDVDLVDWDIDANRPAEIHERRSGLERELSELLNRHSEENESGTPDFILAGFLIGVLDAYNKTLGERAVWRGESVELPSLQKLRSGVQTVPLVTYTNDQRNEIGTADIQVTPGEATVVSPIQSVVPIFEGDRPDGVQSKSVPLVVEEETVGTAHIEKKDGEEQIVAVVDEPTNAFERYQKRGLTQNG